MTVMFICYSTNRPGGCYCFFNQKTLKTYHSRDVTWLARPYWQPSKDKRAGRVLPISTSKDKGKGNPTVSSDPGSVYNGDDNKEEVD